MAGERLGILRSGLFLHQQLVISDVPGQLTQQLLFRYEDAKIARRYETVYDGHTQLWCD